jgi:hypothetical protein
LDAEPRTTLLYRAGHVLGHGERERLRRNGRVEIASLPNTTSLFATDYIHGAFTVEIVIPGGEADL